MLALLFHDACIIYTSLASLILSFVKLENALKRFCIQRTLTYLDILNVLLDKEYANFTATIYYRAEMCYKYNFGSQL